MTDCIESLLNSMSMKFNSEPSPADSCAIDVEGTANQTIAPVVPESRILDLNRDETTKWRSLKKNSNAKKWPDKGLKKTGAKVMNGSKTTTSFGDDKIGEPISIDTNSLLKPEKECAERPQGQQGDAEQGGSGSGINDVGSRQLPKEKVEGANTDQYLDYEDTDSPEKSRNKPRDARRLRRLRQQEFDGSKSGINVTENFDEKRPVKRRGRSKKIVATESTEKNSTEIDGVEKRIQRKRKQIIDVEVDSVKLEDVGEDALITDDIAYDKSKKTRRSVRLEHRNEIKIDSHHSDDDMKFDITTLENSPPLGEVETSPNIIIPSPTVQQRKYEDEKTPPKKRGRRAKVLIIEKQNTENDIKSNHKDTSPILTSPTSKKQLTPKDNSDHAPVIIPKRSQRRIKPTPKILENSELRYEFETKHIERMTSVLNNDNDILPIPNKSSTSRSSSGHRDIKCENSNESQTQSVPLAVKKKLFIPSDLQKYEKKHCPDMNIFLSEVKAGKWHHNKSPEEKKLSKKQQHKLMKQKQKHMERLGLRRVNDEPSDFENTSDDNEEFVPSKRVQVGKPSVTLRLRTSKESTPIAMKVTSPKSTLSTVKKQRQKLHPPPSKTEDNITERLETGTTPKQPNPATLVPNPFYKDPAKELICLCHKQSQYYTRRLPETAFCCAIDHIEEEKIGCCNELSGDLLNLLRPSSRVGYMILCDDHKKRFRAHNCCAGCGIFCTQGKFSFCKQQHFFHPNCAQKFILNSPYDPSSPSNYTSPTLVLKCPHCGIDTPERTSTVTMKCQSLPVFLPSQKAKIKPAKMCLPVVQVPITGNNFNNNNVTKKNNNDVNVRKTVFLETLIPESVMNAVGRATDRRSEIEFSAKDMYYAVKNDDLERVAEILGSGYNVTTCMREFLDGTCLHLVAHSGSIQMAYLLLCKAYPHDFVNMIDRELRTAAMCAVMSDKCDILTLFTQCGADLSIKGHDGKTCLHLAAKLGNLEAVQILVDSYRSTKSISSFFKFINARDDDGWTAMVWAAEHGHTEIVSLLLNHGANPDICDNDNNTVLHWATLYNESLDTYNLLLQAGSDCNVQNLVGDTPLHIACRNSATRLCLALIANGADLVIKNKAGELPYDCIPREDSQCARTVGFNMQMRSIAPTGLRSRIVSSDISNGREQRPIQVVRNEYHMIVASAAAAVSGSSASSDESDDIMLPDFKYITKTIIQQNPVQIDQRVSQMRICSCRDDCTTDQCQCAAASVQNWYTAEGRLNSEFNYEDPPVIFECNDVCGCNKLVCKNRVVQNGIKVPLQIVECDEQTKGWGVRALTNIPKGSFIAEYTGEILTDFEADRRLDDSYFFDLGHDHCIDANYYGNVSRFFNHSCDPNLVPIRVFVEHQDFRFPKIALFASKNIPAGGEICFHYGDKFWSIKRRFFSCKCLSSYCKYSGGKDVSSDRPDHIQPAQQQVQQIQQTQIPSHPEQIQVSLSISNGSAN